MKLVSVYVSFANINSNLTFSPNYNNILYKKTTPQPYRNEKANKKIRIENENDHNFHVSIALGLGKNNFTFPFIV